MRWMLLAGLADNSWVPFSPSLLQLARSLTLSPGSLVDKELSSLTYSKGINPFSYLTPTTATGLG